MSGTVFIFGLVIGSFLNVVGLRVPARQSIIVPRSQCSVCSRPLSLLELIPVISYICLKGTCRTCHTPISPLYPLIELSTALLFAAAFSIFNDLLSLITAWITIALLMIIIVSDIAYMIIPNKVLIAFAGVYIAIWFFLPGPLKADALAGAALSTFVLVPVAICFAGGIGGGDIKLFLLLGFIFGWESFLLLFTLSVWLAGAAGSIGLAAGKIKRGQPFPFGPFIAAASLLTLFYGDFLIHTYLALFQ